MLVSVDLLSAIPGATRIVIADASVGSSGLIALSAVVFKPRANGQWHLLLMDRYGSLIRDRALPRGHAIGKLEVDYDDCVWALGLGDGKDPDNQPVVMKFDGNRSTPVEYFKFSDFSAAAKTPEHLMVQEEATLGVTMSRVWIWLPSARQLRVFMKDGTDVVDYRVEGPQVDGFGSPQSPARMLRVFWQEPDEFLGQVVQISHTPRGPVAQTYVLRWTVEDQRWKVVESIDPAIPDGILAAVHNGEMVFVSRMSDDQNTLIRRVYYH